MKVLTMILFFTFSSTHKAIPLEKNYSFALIELQICSKKKIAQLRSKQELPEVRIKRQVLDHYSTSISNITCHYNSLTIENLPPQSSNQPPHRMKIDDVELDFS